MYPKNVFLKHFGEFLSVSMFHGEGWKNNFQNCFNKWMKNTYRIRNNKQNTKFIDIDF